MSGLGGHGEGLRRSRDEAAGAKPGTKPVDRNAVNVPNRAWSGPVLVRSSRPNGGDRRIVSGKGVRGVEPS